MPSRSDELFLVDVCPYEGTQSNSYGVPEQTITYNLIRKGAVQTLRIEKVSKC